MTFDEAILKLEEPAASEDKNKPVMFVIRFKGRQSGYATLVAKRYHRDKEETIKTLKRAWECFCRGNEDKLESITSISIEYERAADDKRSKDKRLSA